MIDIKNLVYTPIAQALRSQFNGIDVKSDYVRIPSKLPHVSIVESDNYTTTTGLDSGSYEKYSTLMYEVNVYSNKTSGKEAECRSIMAVIDAMMFAFNFTRLSMTPVPNYEDATIYRLTARYRVVTDGENLYRIY